MKTLFLLAIFIWNSALAAKYSRSYIKDPMILTYCENLLNRHKDRKKLQKRAQILLEKNESLLLNLSPNKKTAMRKLELSLTRLRFREKEIAKKVEKTEKDLVHNGCPNFNL